MAAGVDKLCHAFVANDLENYISSIGKKYPYELCFSHDDDVIDSANVMQGGLAFTEHAFEVPGNHDEAGTHCIRRFVNFFVSQLPPTLLHFLYLCPQVLTLYSRNYVLELVKLHKLCPTTHRWLLWKRRSCIDIVIKPTQLRSYNIDLISTQQINDESSKISSKLFTVVYSKQITIVQT